MYFGTLYLRVINYFTYILLTKKPFLQSLSRVFDTVVIFTCNVMLHLLKHFYTPDLSRRVMVWLGRLSVYGCVGQAC